MAIRFCFVAAFLLVTTAHPLVAAYNAAGGYVTLLGHNSGTKGESTFMTNIVRSSYGWSDDRFLIIDDKGLYLIGASLKDLGQKCFAFTKLDAGEIRRIKKTAFGRGESE